ncbi:MAG: ribulose-phosphate 3-epimerase [Ruminococcus sp.]|nr:ribulose-phosphate 3-epimerase [Ruminococcus sp.]
MCINGKNFLFSPSLMCMSFLNIRNDINVLNQNFDTFHIDIADGHFCNNIILSLDYIKDIKKISKLPIEVHLMVDSPNDYIEQLAKIGVNIITVHIESIERNAIRTIDNIHSHGIKVGIALCPLTPVRYIYPLLSYIDIVNVLNVEVGFRGQPLINEMLQKIKKLSILKRTKSLNYIIQGDGGVEKNTYKKLIDVGTESFVLGRTALFSKSEILYDACNIMKSEFENALGFREEV